MISWYVANFTAAILIVVSFEVLVIVGILHHNKVEASKETR